MDGRRGPALRGGATCRSGASGLVCSDGAAPLGVAVEVLGGCLDFDCDCDFDFDFETDDYTERDGDECGFVGLR
jgi:hypothetical protein